MVESDTAKWPPASIEGLARVLHENDRTIGEATGEWTGMNWDALPTATRDGFVGEACKVVITGEFVLGEGWSVENAE